MVFVEMYEAKTNSKGKIVIDDAKKKTVSDNTDTWTQSEIVMFQKGLTKFPLGVAKRWDQIATMIGTRSVEEVIAMSKRFAEDKNIQSIAKPSKLNAPSVADEWTDLQQKSFEDALRKYPANSTVDDRWEAIASSVEGKSKDQCVARFRFLRDLMQK